LKILLLNINKGFDHKFDYLILRELDKINISHIIFIRTTKNKEFYTCTIKIKDIIHSLEVCNVHNIDITLQSAIRHYLHLDMSRMYEYLFIYSRINDKKLVPNYRDFK
jgi:hypothetical protein